jgi:hypothetical protein
MTLTADQVLSLCIGRLAKQGAYGREGNGCSYRTSDGKACAVGVLLTDLEAANNKNNPVAWQAELPDRLLDHRSLLSVLQDLHDRGSHGLSLIDMLLRMAEIDTENYRCG